MSFYPLFLFLTPPLSSARAPLAAIVGGGLFTAKMVLTPFHTAFFPSDHARSGPLRAAARGTDARQRSDGHRRRTARAGAARGRPAGCRVLPRRQRLRSRRRRVLGQGTSARGCHPARAGRRRSGRQRFTAAHRRAGRRRAERRRAGLGHHHHRRRSHRPADGGRRGADRAARARLRRSLPAAVAAHQLDVCAVDRARPPGSSRGSKSPARPTTASWAR